MSRRMLIAGNWKMNGLLADLDFFDVVDGAAGKHSNCDVMVAPSSLLIARAAERISSMTIGGQDCHVAASGAHTGDVSAQMLKDAGARYVIVGHSERRADHGESSELVLSKAKAARKAGLVPIICVGETKSERETGKAVDVVQDQLKKSVPEEGPYIIAYEPVWAIGTGLTASLDDIADMHAAIRKNLTGGDSVQILYGGSVKPGNARDILSLEDVDGALVGGASLKSADFISIIEAAS